jgi:hypothetical protein
VRKAIHSARSSWTAGESLAYRRLEAACLAVRMRPRKGRACGIKKPQWFRRPMSVSSCSYDTREGSSSMAWMELVQARTLLGGSDRRSRRVSTFHPRMVFISDGVALARNLEMERTSLRSIGSAGFGGRPSRCRTNGRISLDVTVQVASE